MTCFKCGKENTAGCFFTISSDELMAEFNITEPMVVWLCYYDCYPQKIKKQYISDKLNKSSEIY